MIEQETGQCFVQEKADAGPMSQVVQEFLKSGDLTAEERAKIDSLAARYAQSGAMLAAGPKSS